MIPRQYSESRHQSSSLWSLCATSFPPHQLPKPFRPPPNRPLPEVEPQQLETRHLCREVRKVRPRGVRSVARHVPCGGVFLLCGAEDGASGGCQQGLITFWGCGWSPRDIDDSKVGYWFCCKCIYCIACWRYWTFRVIMYSVYFKRILDAAVFVAWWSCSLCWIHHTYPFRADVSMPPLPARQSEKWRRCSR